VHRITTVVTYILTMQRQHLTGKIIHCCLSGKLFAVGNAMLGKKITNTVSILTLWAFTYGLFFALSTIHTESMVLSCT